MWRRSGSGFRLSLLHRPDSPPLLWRYSARRALQAAERISPPHDSCFGVAPTAGVSPSGFYVVGHWVFPLRHQKRMPRYFFNVISERRYEDWTGLLLPDLEAARYEAL